ncbi:hypothetical protein [Nostoc favosum]|uniref:Uncharacterized protein n=1 Tax=Nostoc favosum CHAB5714 TaxID=2780399 RepID=A0ABS8I2Y5_9NOSO|nr:hypothetical protein [Nostoc favosum]MCC5597967.1 hypothetical protein [Nostoc favosum CHAB5714]
MQALTLAQLFGVNAVQTATELVIKKSDLVAIGLTPQINNRAEQLVVAILLKALENFQGHLTDPNDNQVTDFQGRKINYDNSNLYKSLLLEPWKEFIEQRLENYVIRNTLIIHQFSEYADTEFS